MNHDDFWAYIAECHRLHQLRAEWAWRYLLADIHSPASLQRAIDAWVVHLSRQRDVSPNGESTLSSEND